MNVNEKVLTNVLTYSQTAFGISFDFFCFMWTFGDRLCFIRYYCIEWHHYISLFHPHSGCIHWLDVARLRLWGIFEFECFNMVSKFGWWASILAQTWTTLHSHLAKQPSPDLTPPPMASEASSSSGLFSNVFSFVSRELESFVTTATGGEPPKVREVSAFKNRRQNLKQGSLNFCPKLILIENIIIISVRYQALW